MEVEDVARIRLAAGRTAQQERELPVGGGLLGQVVVDAERGPPLPVHEVLGHRGPGVGGDVLQRGGVGGRGRDHDRVVHRPHLAQLLDEADDRRLLLADGDVDADDVAAALVDDGVDGDRRLAGTPVADDQLALAAAIDHRVDRLDAGLERLVDRLALGDAGRLPLERPAVGRLDHPAAVERAAERIDDPADERLAAGHREQLAGAADLVALLDLEVVAEDDDADRALLEVEDLPRGAVGELQAFAGHRVRQAVDAGDAVTDLQHPAHLAQVEPERKVAISCAMTELISSTLNLMPLPQDARPRARMISWDVRWESWSRRRSSLLRRLVSNFRSCARTTRPPSSPARPLEQVRPVAGEPFGERGDLGALGVGERNGARDVDVEDVSSSWRASGTPRRSPGRGRGGRAR